jgi:glycosyltransferase involved in cell wall biosynthesis
VASDDREPRVHHHALLARRGGATAVAWSLLGQARARGLECGFSCEVLDGATGEALVAAPDALRAMVPDPALIHLHGSRDWAALLAGLAGRGGPTLATLHDCSLFTGGCPYPLDCRAHLAGCPAACPRGFPEADRAWALRRQALAALRPALAAPSRWLAREAEASLGLPVRVIPNGVAWPAAPPDKAAAKKALGLDPAARVVLFAAHGGLDAAYKAGGAWLALWERVAARVPAALGFMAGGQAMEARGRLALLPYLPSEKLLEFMAAADVLLYPTLADNHPLVVLEAMSRAAAVASCAVGGLPEQVREGETGLLLAPGRWDLLADAAAGLLAAPSRSRGLGLGAWESGRSRFGAERMGADYLKLYRSLSAQAS